MNVFQRREKRTEDNPHFESRPNVEKLWRDSEAVEKILGEALEYQRTKKLEDPLQQCEENQVLPGYPSEDGNHEKVKCTCESKNSPLNSRYGHAKKKSLNASVEVNRATSQQQRDSASDQDRNSIRPPSVKKQLTPTSEPSKRSRRLVLQGGSADEGGNAPGVSVTSYAKNARTTGEDGFLANDRCYRGGGSRRRRNQNLQGVRNRSRRVPKRRVFDDDDIEMEPKKMRKIEPDSDEDLYRMEEDDTEQDMCDAASEDRRVGSVITDAGPPESRTGALLTARERALQCSKRSAASLIEFPEGLSHSAPKTPKDSLPDAERQLQKEEAAIKRREQVEKIAREQQAAAMQRVLSQDSQRKKREGKLQKQREEEKKAAAMAPPTNSIRWVMGTNGTIVSFSQDLQLADVIFSGPRSDPPERERCAGPSCNNSYKYRDSKTCLPLCSLQCYKAVQDQKPALAH